MDNIVSYNPKDVDDFNTIVKRLDKTGVKFIDGDKPSVIVFNPKEWTGLIVHDNKDTGNVPILFLANESDSDLKVNPVQTHDMFVQLVEAWMDGIDEDTYNRKREIGLKNIMEANPLAVMLRDMMGATIEGKPVMDFRKDIAWTGYFDFQGSEDRLRECLEALEKITDITWNSGEKPTEYIPGIDLDSIMGPATFLMVRANTQGQKAIAASVDIRKAIESRGIGPVHEFFTDIDEFVKFVNRK